MAPTSTRRSSPRQGAPAPAAAPELPPHTLEDGTKVNPATGEVVDDDPPIDPEKVREAYQREDIARRAAEAAREALAEAERSELPPGQIGTLVITGTPRQRAALFAAMAQVLGEVSRVPKNGWNAHFNYPFATEADVMDVVRPAMSRAGLCLFPSVEQMNGGAGSAVTGTMGVTFAHAAGATVTTTWMGMVKPAGEKDDKGYWKLYTGVMKYVVLKTFMVPTGDEPEADGNHQGDGRQNSGNRQQRRDRQQARREQRQQDDDGTPAAVDQLRRLDRLAAHQLVPEGVRTRIRASLESGTMTAAQAQDTEAYLRRNIGAAGGDAAAWLADPTPNGNGKHPEPASTPAQAGAPAEDTPPAEGKITTAQAQRIHVIAGKEGWDDGALRLYLHETYGSDHARDCPAATYEDVVANLSIPSVRDHYLDRSEQTST